MTETKWTEAEDTELKELLAKKLSTGAAATELSKKFNRDISRNAVIGRVHRLEKAIGRLPRKKAKVTLPVRNAKAKGTANVFGAIKAMDEVIELPNIFAVPAIKLTPRIKLLREQPTVNARPHSEAPPTPKGPPVSKTTKPCTIEQLNRSTCKFPLGGHSDHPPYMYCGRTTVKGASYCPEHCRVCYTPTGQRRVQRPTYR